jgi:hypothetical protein
VHDGPFGQDAVWKKVLQTVCFLGGAGLPLLTTHGGGPAEETGESSPAWTENDIHGLARIVVIA